MKRTTPFTGIFSLAISLCLWFGSYMISEFAYDLTFWMHTNFLHKGNSIETDAAFIVAIAYSTVTYIAVLLLTASITRFVYKKSLWECVRYQMYRYFAFYALLPLVIVGMSWEKFWVFLPAKEFGYISPIPEFKVVLDCVSAFCESILFLAVVVTMVSIVAFAYGILVNSNVHLNRIYGAIWIVYVYYVSWIVTPYFEYGKWIVLFIAVCYLITATAFISHKIANKPPLVPKYEIMIIPFGEANDIYDELTVDESKDYDFSIFLPKREETDEN